jgi:hypothetical protein
LGEINGKSWGSKADGISDLRGKSGINEVSGTGDRSGISVVRGINERQANRQSGKPPRSSK